MKERSEIIPTMISELENKLELLNKELEDEKESEKNVLINLVTKSKEDYVNKFYEKNSESNSWDREKLILSIASMTLLAGEEAVDDVFKESKNKY